MGLVNAVVPLARLEQETLVWCREMLRNSPTALRVLKSALNAAEDVQAGLQARRMYLAYVGNEYRVQKHNWRSAVSSVQARVM